jgi:hypothetical protein
MYGWKSSRIEFWKWPRMAEFDNVSYVACGIGESDVSIQIVAKDTAEIYQFITEVVRKVPGVRKTTTSIVPLVIKDVYQWRVPERLVRELSERKTLAANRQLTYWRKYVRFTDACNCRSAPANSCLWV